MKENIINRILAIANENERSIRAFELGLGISSGYLNTAKKGKGKIGLDIIQKILDKYPNYKIEWLITGKGEKYVNSSNLLHEPSVEYSETSEIKLLTKKIDDLQNNINRRFVEMEEGGLKTILLTGGETSFKLDLILEKLDHLKEPS